MNLRQTMLILGALCLTATGCNGGGANAGEAGCRDYADAFARSAERCGFDYDANYDAVVQALDLRGCSAFTTLRDEESFYAECIPAIEALTCAQIDDPGLMLPSACSMQLQR